MSDLDQDTAIHGVGAASILASALGMFRSMYVSAQERREAQKREEQNNAERKALSDKVDALGGKMMELNQGLALMNAAMVTSNVRSEGLDKRVTQLEASVEAMRIELARERGYQSGIRKAGE